MNDFIKIREKVASLHVLVVDDEGELLESIVKFMKKIFINVDGAQNGDIALKMLKEDSSYDILLSDIRMPKMSGLELVKELRKVNSEIFITIMTGSPEIDGTTHSGCDLYLAKPINIEKIQLMMEMIIKKRGL